MSTLLMFAGLGFGVVMFILFFGAIISHFTYESPLDEQMRKWLASLSKKDRNKYERHERRKAEYLKLMEKRARICHRIRRKWYYQRKPDDWLKAWNLAARECGGEKLFNSYEDVWSSDDCPIGAFGGASGPLDVEPIDPPGAPKGVWNPRTGRVVQ
jgi:hypothetical protein